jgi:hypothetical protein
MIRVTEHACRRFGERVLPCSYDEAREHILSHSRAIEKAAEFHCEIVRLGDGSRLVLQGATVVTVYSRGERPRQCRRRHSEDRV